MSVHTNTTHADASMHVVLHTAETKTRVEETAGQAHTDR